ncbi:MAG TPA: MltA domain-containing protein [Leptolyngbyaceae cyanobacterium M33_DOE_097]|uniref:peptidoglycan lytic exotransglycosylase n=1 Tax=Oscillatoriales cyanobacterium SpSt-418 TaxID=2282169 RepID=A0A7C3KDY0_9CYAN|nr:MltA domain-containing protein [Leptolyngbyaceae cyanobacterium M33_DOE_097]
MNRFKPPQLLRQPLALLVIGASLLTGAIAVSQPSTTPVPVPLPSPTSSPTPTEPPVYKGPSLIPVAMPANLMGDAQIWGEQGFQGDRKTLLAAIDNSLRYLGSARAANDYRRISIKGVSRDRVRRSLSRFRQLVANSKSASQLQAAVEREFVLYQAAGKDGAGTVDFTGYFEPVHTASPVRTEVYRYPIFRVPKNFSNWRKPHPTRAALEGADGLQYTKSPLRGAELVWLSDRLDAFLIQVQGSARLKLTNGKTLTVGYAGSTDYPYSGIGRELVKDGKFTLEELTLPKLIQYFRDNPADMDRYIPRNNRFVFFRPTNGQPATGSIGLPVLPERSIATDKTKFPPGGLALIQTQLPYVAANGYEQRPVMRYVLDQDTGSAIKGAGRVDVFMGTGKVAGDRAGLVNTPGQLYYLLLK